MAGIKIVDLPPLGRDLASTDLLELSLAGGTGSRKITGQEIMNASKLSINNTPIINGTVGRVLFQGTGDVLQQSSSLFWDATNNRLGIGTSTPAYKLDLFEDVNNYNAIRVRSRNNSIAFEIGATVDYPNSFYIRKNNNEFSIIASGFLTLGTSASTTITLITNNSVRSQITSTGNVLIGTTTDAGFRLDVNGTARVQGLGTFGNSIRVIGQGIFGANDINNAGAVGIDQYGTGGSARIYMCNSAGSAYPIWFDAGGNSYFNTGGNVGIGTSSPSTLLHVAGNITIGGASATTVSSTYNSTTRNQNRYTNGSSFEFHEGVNERVRIAAGGNVGIGTNSPQDTLQANGALRLTGRTGNVQAVSQSALIDFVDTSIFATSPRTRIYAVGTGSIAAQMSFNVGLAGTPIEALRIFGTGNLGINTTTDAGFKLDVNGTLRVTQKVTLNGQLDTNQTGSGHVFSRLNDNGTLIRIFNWNYGNSSGNTWVGGVEVSSALFALNSTTTGFLPPRMTQAQRNAIASPAIGLEIYQTDATEGKYIYKSSGWTYIG